MFVCVCACVCVRVHTCAQINGVKELTPRWSEIVKCECMSAFAHT